jgi:chemotaxis signal transduction protein
MTTANAIRTLSSFVSEGMLSVRGRHISVLDYEKLLKISKIG